MKNASKTPSQISNTPSQKTNTSSNYQSHVPPQLPNTPSFNLPCYKAFDLYTVFGLSKCIGTKRQIQGLFPVCLLALSGLRPPILIMIIIRIMIMMMIIAVFFFLIRTENIIMMRMVDCELFCKLLWFK